ncbi:MAG: hypothetical protein ACO3S0_13440, partial [bacterium]
MSATSRNQLFFHHRHEFHMVYLFLLAIPIVGLLVIRAFYRDFADLGDWLWFQDEYDAISQSI